jgi:hypothetical protein
MRMPRAEMQRLFVAADEAWLVRGERWRARWLVALAAQVSTKRTERADVELTPFYAPTGQMAMRTSIFEKTMEAVRRVDGPADALISWRRSGYDGANYDERAKRDAGVTTTGEPDNRGAPSPTWLAAMAIRLFPVADGEQGAEAVGWQRVRLLPRPYTRRTLVWPTWDPPLDAASARVLLAHPAMRLVESKGTVAVRSAADLPALGVTHVFGASRRTLDQGDGPIGPARVIWSADPTEQPVAVPVEQDAPAG